MRLVDMKPGLVYAAFEYKIWLVVEVHGVRESGHGVSYVDFVEVVLDGQHAGLAHEATFTFVNGSMPENNCYTILAEGT